MRQGNVIVEQVNSIGDIVEDKDCILSPEEIFLRLQRDFPNIQRFEDGLIFGEYRGYRYSIRIKNITYLGIPHPIFKKRIQISDDLLKFIYQSKLHDCEPLLLGIYTYNGVTLYSDFDLEDYIYKKSHNSSAHIMTIDLSKAQQSGIFAKQDYFNNHITTFTPSFVPNFLNAKFQIDAKIILPKIVHIVDRFYGNLDKHWDGKQCYQEMMADHYCNAFQPEWAGFYLEYQMDKGIRENRLGGLIEHTPKKHGSGIDLDLYFPTLDTYGDLKTHTNETSILGNDLNTIHYLLNNPQKRRSLYYIIVQHHTDKDSDYNYEVTKFWNESLHKTDLMSYGKKMKHDVDLTGYYLLEINHSNEKYLDVFSQGKNSNGKQRNPKFSISLKNIDGFLIHKG